MKASDARLKAALDRPPADVRLFLLYGPDEAGAMALADRLGRAMGPEAERIDLDGATLKADPARLADEAAALSLFGGARWVRVVAAGEETVAAVTALLDGEAAGNPVVMIAPGLKATAKLVKLALDADRALAAACYVPSGDALDAIATSIAREHGLRTSGSVARRIATGSGGDRAIMTREIEKLALYLDAAPDRPATLDEAVLDAVGADHGEPDMSDVIDALLAGRGPALGDALRRASEAGVSPIPWLRQLARRLASLAEMRAEVDSGVDVGAVMKRHRVFFKEEATTGAALRRWTPLMLVAAQARVRRVERAVVASGSVGPLLADHDALVIGVRSARR